MLPATSRFHRPGPVSKGEKIAILVAFAALVATIVATVL